MSTIELAWTYRLIVNDPIICGPLHTLMTDKYIVHVYKAHESALYNIRIQKCATGKYVYESRFDPFFKGEINPNRAKDLAIQKLSRFSI